MNTPNRRPDSDRSSSKTARPSFNKKRTQRPRPSSDGAKRPEGGERKSYAPRGASSESQGTARGSRGSSSFSRDASAPRKTYGGSDSRGASSDRGGYSSRGSSTGGYQSRGSTGERSDSRGSSSYSRDASAPRKTYGGSDSRSSSTGGYSRGASSDSRGSSYSRGPSTGASRGGYRSEGATSAPRKTYGGSDSRGASSDRGGYSSRGSSTGGYQSRGSSSYSRGSSSPRGSSAGYSSRGSSSSRGGSSRGGSSRGRTSFNPLQFINTNPVEAVVEVYTPKHLFTDFGFNAQLTKNIADIGLTAPSAIQDQIIPEILKGNDVIGLAQTGTGKTAAFLLPLIEKTMADTSRQTLILTPTRELATQIEAEFQKFAKGLKLTATVCVGGVRIYPQISSLKRKNNFIIGTPGRILDLIKNKHFDTSTINTIVLDEADRMLDMGFINDIKLILSKLPTKRETLFFSATMSNDTHVLVQQFMNTPVTVSVKKQDVTSSIEQNVVAFEDESKFEQLTNLLDTDAFSRVIIFCDMKHATEQLSRNLVRCGIKSVSIHGNKNQGQRQRALDSFKRGESLVLVATDVAARGIHVDDVSHVINYDLPKTFHDYVHRIGRTGRGTKQGKALTFVPARALHNSANSSSHGAGRNDRSSGNRSTGRSSSHRSR